MASPALVPASIPIFLQRRGWAAKSIVAIGVVAADGRTLRCDADHRADFF